VAIFKSLIINHKTKTMKNLIYKTTCGDDFSNVAKKCQQKATDKRNVQFDFNGITCIVSPTTNLEWLWRDYMNANRMDWKTIGHDCLPEYLVEVQAEIDKRNIEAEARAEQQRKEYEAKDKSERELFEAKTQGIEIDVLDKKEWNDWKDKNNDPYGKCCCDYAEGWAKLMQVEIAKGKTVKDCAEETSFQLGFYGITGFMYGCAVSMLAKCWKHGEELRKWHNKEYNHEGEGVVNPAVMTIG